MKYAMRNKSKGMRTVLAASGTLLLGACSWVPAVPGMDRIIGEEGVFRDRQGDYLEAQTIARTEIPPGMDGFIIDDLLVIPDLEQAPTEDFLTAPRPRPLEGRSDREVVIQRMENRSWIIVDVSPSEVWPRIRDYWRQENIEIATENPTAGVMETGWFVLEGNALTKEKIRVTVETGFQDNSAEIRLLQQSSPQSTPDLGLATSWPAQSSDPDTEFQVLNGLSTYLADVANLYQASSVSFLAGNIQSSGKATIVSDAAGGEVLRLQADFNRSWAAVGRALARADVEIVTQDAAEGLYEVRYAPGSEDAEVEEEPGFFKKVFTLNGLFSGDDTLPAFPLRVQIQPANSAVDVRVQSDPSVAAPEDTTDEDAAAAEQALLNLIRTTIA